jgi:hypothetical protein
LRLMKKYLFLNAIAKVIEMTLSRFIHTEKQREIV